MLWMYLNNLTLLCLPEDVDMTSSLVRSTFFCWALSNSFIITKSIYQYFEALLNYYLQRIPNYLTSTKKLCIELAGIYVVLKGKH